ncbi:MAG: hypothetical protein H6Q57_284 [Geobacteraceae bacterium]|nr:hypothetical protein [Geobacteraceae bacterium]
MSLFTVSTGQYFSGRAIKFIKQPHNFKIYHRDVYLIISLTEAEIDNG